MRLIVLLGVLAGLAFGADPDAPLPIEPAPTRPIDPAPTQPNPNPRTCEDIETDARALLAEAQACSTTESCELVSFEEMLGPDSCTAAFQCTAPLSTELDRAAFVTAARRLVEEKRACGECTEAACRPPQDLRAECVEGRCVLTQRPPRPEPGLPRGF